jgi:hypothetical protein
MKNVKLKSMKDYNLPAKISRMAGDPYGWMLFGPSGIVVKRNSPPNATTTISKEIPITFLSFIIFLSCRVFLGSTMVSFSYQGGFFGKAMFVSY